MNASITEKIGGKTHEEWDLNWRDIGTLDNADLSKLSKVVGLYKATLKGKISYIGRAIEHSNGGLRKRLSDYKRSSNSSRKHKSGQLMNKNSADLEIEVLITGNNKIAAEIAKKLEKHFIRFHRPVWNKMLKPKQSFRATNLIKTILIEEEMWKS